MARDHNKIPDIRAGAMAPLEGCSRETVDLWQEGIGEGVGAVRQLSRFFGVAWCSWRDENRITT